MALPTFTMTFDPLTIEHLGLRLYSTLPPVVSELVSNAHDAESSKAEVVLPEGSITDTSEVIVRDYGHGMTPAEIQAEYLPIGRNRRGTDGKAIRSKNGKVVVTGRKGLGKLSGLGVATELEVRSVKDGDAVCLRINYDEITTWPLTKPGQPYEPTVIPARTGKTTDPNGVEVTLRKLHRKTPIDKDEIRRGLARRLSMVGESFQVYINGEPIRPEDRCRKSECPEGFAWDVSEAPGGSDLGSGLQVTGWIGFLEKSSQSDRGVDIFANRKAVELGSFFNDPSTHVQYARAYVVGQIHADFLDGEKDLASTARSSVVWESDAGSALQNWGRKTLRWAFEKWAQLRRKEKEEKVVKAAGFDKWLETRRPAEQKVAQKMLKLLVDDEKIEPDSTKPLLEIIKSSVETVAFRELVEEIESGGSVSAAMLLRLFDDWRVIEAREHLNLADGRRAAIEQLDGYIKSGALEVQQMQPLFEQNPWLFDPTWSEAAGQTTYTKWLREKCPEPKDYEDVDRRIDILGIRAGGGVTVVELKRPETTLLWKYLDQIERYVLWMRDQAGTGSDAPRYVSGLLLVGKLSTYGDVKARMERLHGADIRVETYGNLRDRAFEYYGSAERLLDRIAPEYVKRRKKK